MESILLSNDSIVVYIIKSNSDRYNKKIRYTPCKSCGLGNKLLGLISSIACGISYSSSLKVIGWNSLWYYFLFPLKLDLKNYSFVNTYVGHFYGIKNVIENEKTRKYLLEKRIIKIYKNINSMIHSFAYTISTHFLQVNSVIKSFIGSQFRNIYYGMHIRTGEADGKEFLLHYLKYEDVINILNFIEKIHNNKSIYISSDSPKIKRKYRSYIRNLNYLNTTSCNSGFGLLKEKSKCAIEAVSDYYILSRCKYLLLTRCSSFSLVSLFANKIGYSNIKRHIYFGNCTIHSDLFS